MNFSNLFSLFLKNQSLEFMIWMFDLKTQPWNAEWATIQLLFWTQHGIDLLKALFYIQKVIVIYINFLL